MVFNSTLFAMIKSKLQTQYQLCRLWHLISIVDAASLMRTFFIGLLCMTNNEDLLTITGMFAALTENINAFVHGMRQ